MSRIYFVTLAKATPNPLRPKLDDDPAEKEASKKDAKKDEKKDARAAKSDGRSRRAAGRIVALPVPAANYRSLTSAGNGLYYQRFGGRDAGPQFFVFDLATRKESSLGSVNGYEISADGKKMLISKDGKYGIIDLPKGGPVSIGRAA